MNLVSEIMQMPVKFSKPISRPRLTPFPVTNDSGVETRADLRPSQAGSGGLRASPRLATFPRSRRSGGRASTGQEGWVLAT
jgi:hypothetical protein